MNTDFSKFTSIIGAASLLICSSSLAADVEYGEYLSSQCVSCHTSSQDDKRQIPNINGLDQASFVALMESYKNKDRDNKTMQTVAAGLDDEQLAALAAFYATLTSN